MKNKKTKVYWAELFNEKAGYVKDGKMYTKNDKLLACYDQETIYRMEGWIFTKKVQLGSYKNGRVYKGQGTRDCIGSYDRKSIYKGTGFFSKKIGTYDGDEGGPAAALMLLFHKEIYEILYDDLSGELDDEELEDFLF